MCRLQITFPPIVKPTFSNLIRFIISCYSQKLDYNTKKKKKKEVNTSQKNATKLFDQKIEARIKAARWYNLISVKDYTNQFK
jgi:hypothetical protein